MYVSMGQYGLRRWRTLELRRLMGCSPAASLPEAKRCSDAAL